MDFTALDISARVKLQYEEYPYPDYSFYIPLRTQEAYASHSLFSAHLAREKGLVAPVFELKDIRILIAGSGDILPFILSFWEPETHKLHAVDLSETNLRRARLRSVFRPHAFTWQAGNLEDQTFALPRDLAHVDSYGVLHHLANPALTLQRLSALMLPGATMRVMVYNKEARSWIHHLQRAFALCGLSAYDRKDLDAAVRLLKRLSVISPFFQQRLTPMKAGIFHHSARFVDTFFHAREARLSWEYWSQAFEKAGLDTLGLFDRYAELDDLANPLLTCPSLRELEERALDRRFENNFEIYLRKRGGSPLNGKALAPSKLPTRWRLRMPPKAWFSYSETNRIPLTMRFALWANFLRTLEGKAGAQAFDQAAKSLRPESLQRLARLGAIFPSNFESKDLKNLLISPIHTSMDRPVFAEAVGLRHDPELKQILESALLSKGKTLSCLTLVFARLEAAQKA